MAPHIQSLLIWSAIRHAGVVPAVVALGPKRRNAGAVLALVPAVAAFAAFWSAPGFLAVVAGMASLLFWLRVMDARAWYSGEDRLGYALFVNYVSTHPSEDRAPSPAGERALQALRGCAALALAGGFWVWNHEQPLWQRGHFYADSALAALEVFLVFLGISDLVTSGVHTMGLKSFLVDSLDPRALWSPSLRAFWGKHWNRTTAGTLRRGIFEPLNGRRHRLRGVVAVFFACGVMHALPLVLLTPNRRHGWILVGGVMLFFVGHGLAVVLEGALPRKVRKGGVPRLLLYATWALTIPFYPPLLAMMTGLHGGRRVDSYVLIRWFG